MANFTVTNERDVSGVREVRITIDMGEEQVPLLVYLPEKAAGAPLVFIQHPATSSKDDAFVQGTAAQWARDEGWTCAGIDAPNHGERLGDPMSLFSDSDAFPAIRAQFAAEIAAAIDVIAETEDVDTGRVGYASYSMGSMLGIHAVAADPRFKAAAFFAVGAGQLAGPVAGNESAVPGLTDVATLIVGKSSDELVPRAATEELYEAIGGTKELKYLPGGHFEMGPDIVLTAVEWLRERFLRRKNW